MCGEEIEILAQRALPQLAAVFGKGDQVAAAAHHVHVARFEITHGSGPADAVRRHIALVDIEPALPEHLAGIGVEAHQAFLKRLSFAGAVQQVQVIAHDDRRGAASVGRLPCEILPAERPFLGQALLFGNAVVRWAAPIGPFADGNRGRMNYGGRK